MNNIVKYIKLKDICTVNQWLQIPISKRFSKTWKNRYFYITVQFLKDWFKDKYYVESPPISSICNKNDILVVRTWNTWQIIYWVEWCFHNNFFKVNYDKEKIIWKYLYYCLNTKEKRLDMLLRAWVTTIPDLNHFMFLDMKIPLLDKNYQEYLVKILDWINSKIELNNKINAELEKMAKTLYDYWFVQFDFPDENWKPYKSSGWKMVWTDELKREIPEKWEVKKLKDIFEFQKWVEPWANEYFDLLKDNNSIKFYRVWDIDWSSKTYIDSSYKNYQLATEKDVIVTFDGSVWKLWFWINWAFSWWLRKIYDKTWKYDNSLVFSIFRDERIISTIHKYATWSIILHASSSIEHLIIPFNEENYLKFQNIIKPNFEKMVSIKKENQKLAELRDWLLPMLMNWQVSVK